VSVLVLGVATLTEHLEELEQLLKGIAMMKELTPRTQDYLVSFGECMSTRIFAAYLNTIGVKARQVCFSCLPMEYILQLKKFSFVIADEDSLTMDPNHIICF
jgi:aspartokinase